MLLKAYTTSNNDINSYYVADMENPPSWSTQITNDFVAGHHRFGYVKTNDPKYVDMTTLKPIKTASKNASKSVKKSTPKKAPVTYVVKKGDTLWRIAKKNKVSVKDLMTNNNISNPKSLKVG